MRQALDKISTQILRYVPFILAFLVPLFFLPITSEMFVFNKFYLVSFLASLSLAAWCLRSLTRGTLNITTSPSLIPLILLAVFNIISSVWVSPVKHVSLFGQTSLFTGLVIIFITATSSQKNRVLVNTVITGLISTTVILSLTTVLHRFDLLSKLFSSNLLSSDFFNLAGGILPALAFTIPVLLSTIAYLIISKNWLTKSILFASSVIMIVATLINLTLILPQSGEQVVFLLPYRASWSIAVDIFKNWQTGLLGTGPETYLTTFTRLRPSYLNLNDALWGLRFPESGSYLLTLVTTTGILGLLAFFFAFLRPISVAIQHRTSHLDNPAFVFLSLSTVTALFSYVFLPSGTVSLVLGFVSLIALTVEFKLLGFKNTKDLALSISAKSEPESIYSEISETEKVSPNSLVLPWILTILSAVLISLYWFYALPAYSASVSAAQANELVKTNPVGAYLKVVNAAKLNPYHSSYPLTLSQFFKTAAISFLNKEQATEEDKKNASDYMQRAIDYGKQAAVLDPFNVAVWENLSDIYQSFIGTAEGAENFAVSHLAQAIILDPTNPKLRLKLGILFFNLGDSDQALKLISQAIELRQTWDVPYFNTAAIYKYKKEYSRALQYMKVGLQYTDQNSEDYAKVQEEIKAVEKLLPTQNATPSATTR